ncbi:MAG: methyltransferase [Myxococcales bacterium]|nr:methyltransferase [Myxococcales bacterium]MCB9543868.1 methyltransferase [Myxococcales bacterium]
MTPQARLEAVLARKRHTAIRGFAVVTDPLDYTEIDQVFPIYAEQAFFLDEIVPDAIKGAAALEVGVGSGVLSIGAIRAGAAKVTALEINPRARNIAGFNIVMNGFEDRIAIVDGAADVFAPVAGRKFDYIFSNPPFEPTPPDHPFFYHSAAGPFGLDFIEAMFKGVYDVLAPGGHLQIVTAAPGDETGPFLLAELARQHLSGSTRIVSSPVSLDYYEALDWLPEKGFFTREQTEELKRMARAKGITRSHLCVLHHDHDGTGSTDVTMTTSSETYASPEIPFE